MTGPEKVTGYRSRDGRIFDTMNEALIADMCDIIKKSAEEKHNGNVLKLFHAFEEVEELRKEGAPVQVVQIIAGHEVEIEVKIIVHWVIHNMDLLETLINYYLDARAQETEKNSS